MPASSLSSTARKACIKNIRSITDIGEIPYDIVRPVLLKLENPVQLRQIEEASPQIIGHDEEIWLEFIKRDVQDWDKKPHRAANPNSWHKVYKKLVRESQNQISKDAEFLKKTMDDIYTERSKHKLKQVELDFIPLPDDMKRSGPTIHVNQTIRLIDRGTQHGPQPSQKQLKIERGELDPNAPRKTAPPIKGILDKFRRDARQAMPRFGQQSKNPTGIITARAMALKQKSTNTTIVKAPRAMIEEHRQASVPKPLDPTIKAPAVFNPKKRKIEHYDDGSPAVNIFQEREKRLKAFTAPSTQAAASSNIRIPKSLASTPPVTSPSPPPAEKVSTQISRIVPRGPLPQPQVTSKTAASSKAMDKGSLAPGLQLSRSNTSSPNNEGVRPVMKRKAPADIFMRPSKKKRPT